MKLIVLFCLALVTLGLRNTHKSQYDLGYEEGLMDALEAMELVDESLEEGPPPRSRPGCAYFCSSYPLSVVRSSPSCRSC